MAHIFHFKCTVKCRLQFVSIWTSLKFSSGNGLDSELVGRNGIHSASWEKNYVGLSLDLQLNLCKRPPLLRDHLY